MTDERSKEIRATAAKHAEKLCGKLLNECLDDRADLLAQIEKLKARRRNTDKAELPEALTNQPGFTEEWQAFRRTRESLRKPLTDRAAVLILRKLEQRPGEAVRALQACIEKGWQSFEWDWLGNGGNGSKPKAHFKL